MASELDRIKTDQSLLRFLHRQGKISVQNALNLEHVAAGSSHSIIEVLQQEGVITQGDLAALLAQTLRLPLIDLKEFAGNRQVMAALKGSIAKRYEVVPLRLQEHSIEVAMANPLELDAVRAVEFATGRRARVGVATQMEIRDALLRFYDNSVQTEPDAEQTASETFTPPSNGHTAAAQAIDDEFVVAESRADGVREARLQSALAQVPDSAPPLSLEEPDLECREAKGEPHAYGEQIALQATEALARADEAVRRIDALAAIARTPNPGTAELVGRLAADCRALRKSVGELERRLTSVAAQQESSRAELQPLVEQAQLQSRQAATEALGRADTALQRVETLTASTQAQDAKTAELVGRLVTDGEALRKSVADVEQRLAAAAARPETSPGAELRPLLEQLQRESQLGIADALARADEAVRRVQALASAESVPDTTTAKLVGRLAADCHALNRSVRDIEKRLTAVAVRQESSQAELPTLIEQVQQQSRQTAAEALVRADDALGRIEAVTASVQAHDASTTELVSRLATQYDALRKSAENFEQRLADLASHQEGFSRTTLQPLIEEVHAKVQQGAVEARACGEEAATQAAAAGARADEAIRSIEALAGAGRVRDTATAELIGSLRADYDSLHSSVDECGRQLAAVAARQEESPRAEWQPVLERVQLESQRGVAEALTRSDEMLRRLEALTATAETRDASTAEAVGRLTSDCDALKASVGDVKQRLGALAARQESSQAEFPSLIEQVRLESRQAIAEAATRADEAIRRADTVAAASRVPDPTVAKLTGRLAADCHTLKRSMRDIEQRLTAVAARHDSSQAELRPALEQVQRQAQQGIAAALARTDEAVGQIESLAAATRTRDDAAVELVNRLATDGTALTTSLTDVERRLSALATRYDSSQAELRPLLEQVQQRSEEGIAEALTRANEAIVRIAAVSAAAQTRDDVSAELVERLVTEGDALRCSLGDLEQRLATLAARQEAAHAELQPVLEQVQRQSEQGIIEALARADEAVGQIQALAATAHARDGGTAEHIARLATDCAALRGSMDGVEQRLAALAARHESSQAELPPLLRQVRLESRHAVAEAVARADEAVKHIETLAAAAQARESNIVEFIGRLGGDRDVLKSSLADVEQRLATLVARQEAAQAELRPLLEEVRLESRQASAEAAEHADDAVRRIEALSATPPGPDLDTVKLTERLAADCHALQRSMDEIDERLSALAGRLESPQTELQSLLDPIQQRFQQGITAALARADDAVAQIQLLAATTQARDTSSAELLSRLSADCSGLKDSVGDLGERFAEWQDLSPTQMRTLLEQVQQHQHSIAEARRRTDEALTRIEALRAAAQTTDAGAAELIDGLSADFDLLRGSVAEIERRLAAVAERQDSSQAELQPLSEQLQKLQLAVAAASARTEEAHQHIATFAAPRVHDVTTATVAGQLTADYETLKRSVHELEQRLIALAARQESSRPEIDGAVEELRQQSERAIVDALARVDDTGRRIVAVAADFDLLRNSISDLEQRVTVLATQQEELAPADFKAFIGQVQSESQRGVVDALARADEALRRSEALAADAHARDSGSAEIIGRLATECATFRHAIEDGERRLAALAARQESSASELQPLLEQLRAESQQGIAETASRVDEALRRIQSLAAAMRVPDAATAKLVGRLAADSRGLERSIRGVEQRVAALAVQHESSRAELGPVIEQVQTESRHAAATASARAAEVARQLEALATAAQARDANTTERIDHFSARSDALRDAVSQVEPRLAALADRQESSETKLGLFMEQMHIESRQAMAAASAQADEAARRLDALAAATRSRDAGTTERVDDLAARFDALGNAVSEIEQHLAAVATQQQAVAQSDLQPLIDQLRLESQQSLAEVHARNQQVASQAAQAVVRADEALRQVATLAAGAQAHAAGTVELAGRLTADYEALKSSVGTFEQRVAAIAPRAEASLRTQLEPLIERVQLESLQAAAEARACGQKAALRAAEAAAQADAAVRRVEELTATLQAQDQPTEELTELQTAIDDLAQERADLETQVQNTAARVARLNDSLLTLRGRVRPGAARLSASGTRARLRRTLVPARSQLRSAFITGAAELLYRGSRVLRKVPDLLLIAGLILVATLVAYIGLTPNHAP